MFLLCEKIIVPIEVLTHFQSFGMIICALFRRKEVRDG